LSGDNRSQSARERTDEQRERAREEREQRRLARQGKAAPPLPPPEPVPPVETPPTARLDARQRPSLHRPHVHRPHLQRPHLQRPHLHRSPVPRVRNGAARVGAVGALVLALAVVGAGGALLVRSLRRSKAPAAPAIVKVVIPEGETRAQIASIARADGLKGDYLAASKHSAKLRPARYGAPVGTKTLEGFLFPATYEMYAGAPVSRLVSEQLAAFRENFGGTLKGTSAEVHRAKALGVAPYQLLIVASMIEREAAVPRDRPLVAAVIYNRLRLRMPLGIDATIRYALGDYTHPLTEAQLKTGSPYNTRTHRGLTPTPISNPGLASIGAAARPAHVPYLYYVAGADGCGEQVFSTTYAQFEKDAAAYQAALRKNGGRVPACRRK